MKLWSCPREFPDSTIWIVAGGPSIRGVDLDCLKGRKVIAINSSVFKVPFADFLFFGDSRWWYQNHPLLKDFRGRCVTTTTAHTDPRVLYMRKVKPKPGLAEEPCALSMQYTSLQAAINLAWHLGASRMILLGADNAPAKDGASHHHKPHTWPQRADCWDLQMQSLATIVKPLRKRGIEVINTSLESRLPWWPKKALAECLTQYA